MQFTDRKVEFPNRVKMKQVRQESDGSIVYDIERSEGTVVNAGTPLNADNLNFITENLETELRETNEKIGGNGIFSVFNVYLDTTGSATGYVRGNLNATKIGNKVWIFEGNCRRGNSNAIPEEFKYRIINVERLNEMCGVIFNTWSTKGSWQAIGSNGLYHLSMMNCGTYIEPSPNSLYFARIGTQDGSVGGAQLVTNLLSYATNTEAVAQIFFKFLISEK